MALLGESLTPRIALGGGAVIVGGLFLTGGFRRGARRAALSLGFGIAAGTLIGGDAAWDACAVSTLLIPPLLLDYASSVGRAVILAPVAFRRRAQVARLWRAHRRGVIVIALFNPLAYILALTAPSFTPVVYVAPTRDLIVLLTVLAGGLLLGEAELGRRLAWGAVMVAGVVVLASG